TRRSLEAEKSVLENALEGVIRLDAEGNLSQVNGAFARLMKSEPEVLRGVPWRSVIAPADHAQLREVLSRPGRTEVSLTAQRRDGREVPVDLVVLTLSDGWAIFLRDMTRQRAMEDRLFEHNAALQRFASTAAHDLQEPIRMIVGYLELIERRYANKLDDSGHEFIGLAVDGATRMERLIRELLKFTRLDAVAQTETCPLNKLLDEVLLDLERLIEEAGARVEVADLPTLEVQPTRLRQVFQNLIGNALKFRRPEVTPVVRVGCERAGESWVFSVQDNGIGIPSDCVDKVFQPLFRGHSSEDYSGTGLGLATCQRIVAAHGGRIWAEGPPEGGTVIRFSLPDTAPQST
ncbi:MAG: PAS domain-containing protein, partial [Candidatus Eremiobacteraeota bacterium]|nr:PAS domain-containing protein [Candidatus Eremiobacteraeota bacterium]